MKDNYRYNVPVNNLHRVRSKSKDCKAITCVRYAQSQKVVKPNNLKVFRGK